MIRPHWMLAAVFAVSLTAGYLAGRGGNASAGAGGSDAAQALQRPDRPALRTERHGRGSAGDELLAEVLKGRSARDLSGPELMGIFLELQKHDPGDDPLARARRAYQYQLLLAKLSTSQLEQAVESLAADPEGRRQVRSVISALAERDPQRAMTWAKAQPNSRELIAAVIGRIAGNDPQRAAELLRGEILDGGLREQIWSVLPEVSAAMAKLGKDRFLEFLDTLPAGQQSNFLIQGSGTLPEGDRLAMMDEVHRRSNDGRMHEWFLRNFISGMAAKDPVRAEAWLKAMEPGKQRASLEISQAAAFSRTGDNAAAREWLSRAIAQMKGKELELLPDFLNAVRYESASPAMFVELLPEDVEIREKDLKQYAGQILHYSLGDLADLATLIRDPAEQTELIANTLTEIVARREQNPHMWKSAADFEILSRRLQTLGLTGDHAARVEEALAAARNAVPRPRQDDPFE